MILTEYVTIELCSQYIKHLENRGYILPKKKSLYKKCDVYDIGKEIVIKTEDLLPYNHTIKFEALCEYCHEPYMTTMQSYNHSLNCVVPKACCGKKKCMVQKTCECNKVVYGVESTLQVDEIREKAEQGMLRKYGYKNASHVPELIQKKNEKCIEKYGTMYPSQTEPVKQKIQDTIQTRYNVTSIFHLDSVKNQIAESYYRHGSAKCSKQQEYLWILFGGELNYPCNAFNIDICFPDELLAIEYNGSGHGLVYKQFNEITESEFKKKEYVRSMILKENGYKIITFISDKDNIPSDEKLLEILELSKQYFSDYPNHSWIEWFFDEGIYKNAEHKDGVPFDFGKLRKIKKEDINNGKEAC